MKDAAKRSLAPEELIPRGAYCYDLLPPHATTASGGMQTRKRVCPFWEPTAQGSDGSTLRARCTYLQEGDEGDRGLTLFWEQVKNCTVNDSWMSPEIAAEQ